jgi:hypothetical protein
MPLRFNSRQELPGFTLYRNRSSSARLCGRNEFAHRGGLLFSAKSPANFAELKGARELISFTAEGSSVLSARLWACLNRFTR